MGLGEQFQTIIYYEDTGDIREILPNQYIKSRRALNDLLGLPESRGIKFFYMPGYYPLLKEEWIVKPGTKNKAPRLVSQDGKDGALVMAQKGAEHILKHYKEVLFVFEGGMGDYLDQADVMIACKQKYPEKKLKVALDGSRRSALNLIAGFADAVTAHGQDPKTTRGPSIEFKAINSLCGNYKPHGKIGAYSTIAGLETPAKRAKINIPENDINNARALIEEKIGKEYKTIIALHTMSGNCNTKGIRPETLPELLTALMDKKDLYLLHLGGHGEEIIKHKQFIPLQGKLNWPEVFAVMSLCDGCVCIDSAILHIAQHLNLPTVSFWGPTDVDNILGKDPGMESATIILDCKNCNRFDCNKKNCMENLDQKEINRKIKKMLRG